MQHDDVFKDALDALHTLYAEGALEYHRNVNGVFMFGII